MAGYTRRRFLEIAGVAGGGVLLNTSLMPLAARAQQAPAQDGLLLAVYFNGGWDQLLALDPRDHTDARFGTEAGFRASGIQTAYNVVTDAGVQSVMSATGGRGVQARGNLTFGPAVHASLLEHAADLSIVRGMDMETLTHEVGRRYLITGKFPRGLAAAGSSLGTVVAAANGQTKNIPHLSVACEAYNEEHEAYASPIQVSSSSAMVNVLRPAGTALSAASTSLLNDFHSVTDCGPAPLDLQGKASLFATSRHKASQITQGGVFDLFDFSRTSNPEVASLLSAMNMSTSEINTPKGRAALAGQALATGYAQAVSLQIQAGLDHHFDNWRTSHAQLLRPGFEALGNLIGFLKGKEYLGTGTSVWSRTTLLVFSEFSRTPRLNSSGGRDHHLSASALVAGPGIRPNMVYGASSDLNQAVQFVDVATGQVKSAADGGRKIRPADLHHTLLTSMNLDSSHLSNQSPIVLTGLTR